MADGLVQVRLARLHPVRSRFQLRHRNLECRRVGKVKLRRVAVQGLVPARLYVLEHVLYRLQGVAEVPPRKKPVIYVARFLYPNHSWQIV